MLAALRQAGHSSLSPALQSKRHVPLSSSDAALAGQALFQDGKAGQAVRCFTAAQALASSVRQLGPAYDKAAPATPAGDRQFFDEDLSTLIDTTFAKVLLKQRTVDWEH